MIFRRVRKIAKSDYSLCHVRPSVLPSARNNSAPTGRIFIKFQLVAQCMTQLRHRMLLIYYSISVNSS
jgi:hypothetical protein